MLHQHQQTAAGLFHVSHLTRSPLSHFPPAPHSALSPLCITTLSPCSERRTPDLLRCQAMPMSTAAIDDVKQDSIVFFPPLELVDFVIHYDSTAFYVHKLLLHHHSAYFRAYLLLLNSQGSPASPTRRRARSSTSFSVNEEQHCDHPTIAHCIHLPQQTRLVEQTPVTAADLHLFLCHLYFRQHYCYPPYLPESDIDLNNTSPPLSFTFPALTLLDSDEVADLNCPLPHDDVVLLCWGDYRTVRRRSDYDEPASFRHFTTGDQLDAADEQRRWGRGTVTDVAEGKVLIQGTEWPNEYSSAVTTRTPSGQGSAHRLPHTIPLHRTICLCNHRFQCSLDVLIACTVCLSSGAIWTATDLHRCTLARMPSSDATRRCCCSLTT